jgi:Amt family ammonium transporter
MRRTMALKVLPALLAGLMLAVVVPGLASADTLDAYNSSKGSVANTVGLDSVGVNTLWVIVAGMVVMFMQAGFMFLEIGFSRQKNAGTVVAKILTNFSIAAVCWYLVGFAFAFGSPVHGLDGVIGGAGFLLQGFGDPLTAFPIMGVSNATVESKWFFQFVFCAVSLAIVWGSTLERIKFGVYIIYAVVFASVIYPIGAHWVFGGGFLQVPVGLWKDIGFVGMQDFAGSTAVHLIGAATTCRCSASRSWSCGSAGSGSTRARRSTSRTGASRRSCSSRTSRPPAACSAR